MIILRDYQERFINAIRAEFDAGVQSVLAVASTGAGKTICFSYIAECAAALGNSTYILVHLKELVKQTSASLLKNGIPHGVIASGWPQQLGFPIQVCSVQTLAQRLDRYQPPFLLVTDECFPAGTLIDDVLIENIRVGDMVTSWNGKTFEKRRVNRIFKRHYSGDLVQLFISGRFLICTPTHPILTGDGWKCAGQIRLGDEVQVNELHGMWINDSSAYEGQEGLFSENGPNLLQQNMQPGSEASNFVDHHESNESEICVKAHEKSQSHEERGNSAENGRSFEGNGTQTSNSRWQWKTGADSSAIACAETWIANGDNSCYKNEIALPRTLQIRHRRYQVNDSDRSGRGESRGAPGSRSEERSLPFFARVDGIEIFESGSSRGSRAMRGDCHVYNFEVDHTHTYTANGVVVHNCHHVPAPRYKPVLEWASSSFHLGVTATPLRRDGKGFTEYYQRMVQADDIATLINDGWLSRPIIYAPKIDFDLSNVDVLGGDYNRGQLDFVMDKPSITGCAVEHYRRILPNSPLSIAFTTSVASARHLAEDFIKNGVPAASIDGAMSDHERSKIIQTMARRNYGVLTSCDLISEGFDLSAAAGMDVSIACAILLRPTQSTALHLQQCGRALRPSTGKAETIILDHVENWKRHGLVDDVREWSLEGRKKRTKTDRGETLATCPSCYAVFPPLPICPSCGHVMAVKTTGGERKIEQKEGELVQLNAETAQAFRRKAAGFGPQVRKLERA